VKFGMIFARANAKKCAGKFIRKMAKILRLTEWVRNFVNFITVF